MDEKSDRRGFFRHAMAHLVQPIAELVENVSSARSLPLHLRPPGAIGEDAFLETCSRCEQCVLACPADAIFLLGREVPASRSTMASKFTGDASGTPVIDPDHAPCVVCDGLQCTQVCESGALVKLTDPRQIRMGVAEVYGPLCVRTEGESCRICVDRCPIGIEALRFDGDGPPLVESGGCVGCGVCQNVCPTMPKAIVVKSRVR